MSFERPNYEMKPNNPKWLRTLAFLKALGAPEPRYETHNGITEACFGEIKTLYVGLAAEAPGVAATDLYRDGLVKLAPGHTGLPHLPIDVLENWLPDIKAKEDKINEL